MQCLRRAAGMAAEGIKVGEQLRTYKGLPVKKNTFVESWYNKREDMEISAVITNGMLFSGFVWGLAVPYFAYEALQTEFELSRTVLGTHHDVIIYPAAVPYEPSTSSQ